MAVGLKNVERVRLTGKNIEAVFEDVRGSLYTYLLTIDRYLGEGASCICYEVTVRKGSDMAGQKRVLKQFYPSPIEYEIDADMSGMSLHIEGYDDDIQRSHCPEVTELGHKFETAFRRQVELSNRKELGGVIVRPDLCYFSGSTKYILYEPDFGTTLNFDSIDSAELLVERMLGLATALSRLHEEGFIYMDLKPENVLVSADGRVKVFDFDALIDLNDLDNVHLKNGDVRYDTTDIRLIAPEIRPENLINFELDKSFILTERADIYSFGAIMLSYFLKRYPAPEDTKDGAFIHELHELFQRGSRRGELTESEQDMLCDIIRRCINENIGPRGRYRSSRILTKELTELLEMIGSPISKRRRFYNRINGRLVSAGVLNNAPLCDYILKDDQGSAVMDCAIIGEDRVCEDFLANIISGAYMRDVRLVIRRYGKNAQAKMDALLEKWPLLKKTTDLYLEDEKIEGTYKGLEIGLDKRITGKAFAEIRFYESAEGDIPEELPSSWIAAAYGRESAAGIAQKLKGRRAFIAYIDERGDGYDLHEPETVDGNIMLLPFGVNSKRSLEEKQFEKGLNRKAFMLHCLYAALWNERLTRKERWEDFTSGEYNISSCVCSVLSIPYKLKSEEDSALSVPEKLHLEHRRWMGFMLTQGYDRPEEFESYAYKGRNDRRDKERRLHPCICSSSESGAALSKFTHTEWDNYNIEKNEAGLDMLDLFSIRFHRFCDRRVKEMSEQGVFDDAFAALDRTLRDEKCTGEITDSVQVLKNVHAALVTGVSSMNHRWSRAVSDLRRICMRESQAGRIVTAEIEEALEEICDITRIVEERNLYHDYKSSDMMILEAVPFLMAEDKRVRRVYKVSSKDALADAVCSVIIEPEELVLYTDDPGEEDRIREFLVSRRGIDVKKITLKPMSEIGAITHNARSISSVIDVTGVDEQTVSELKARKNLRGLPFIYYENGKISSTENNGIPEMYGGIRRHFSVEEAIRLKRADIRLKEGADSILGAVGDYKKIWEASQRLGQEVYGNIAEALEKGELRNRLELVKSGSRDEKCACIDEKSSVDESREAVFERFSIAEGMIASTGIGRVCEELAGDGYIESDYLLPRAGKIGNVKIRCKSTRVRACFEEMFARAFAEPYMHEFKYINGEASDPERREASDPEREEARDHIEDNTLVIDCEMDERDAKAAVSHLGFALRLEVVPEQGRVRGAFISRAVKECLTGRDNLKRAIAYHELWDRRDVDDVRIAENSDIVYVCGTELRIDRL